MKKVLRAATVDDIDGIMGVVNSFADKQLMLPLNKKTLYDRILEYMVYEIDGEVVGVCAIHPSWGGVAEIRSLAVSDEYHGQSIGRELMLAQLKRAKELKFKRVFALTYQAEYFKRFGFNITTVENYPVKVWTDCVRCKNFGNCHEIAVELILE